MYCQLGFGQHLTENPQQELGNVELPAAVPATTQQTSKSMFWELEVSKMGMVIGTLYQERQCFSMPDTALWST